jgi:hypothetical protein
MKNELTVNGDWSPLKSNIDMQAIMAQLGKPAYDPYTCLLVNELGGILRNAAQLSLVQHGAVQLDLLKLMDFTMCCCVIGHSSGLQIETDIGAVFASQKRWLSLLVTAIRADQRALANVQCFYRKRVFNAPLLRRMPAVHLRPGSFKLQAVCRAKGTQLDSLNSAQWYGFATFQSQILVRNKGS